MSRTARSSSGSRPSIGLELCRYRGEALRP